MSDLTQPVFQIMFLTHSLSPSLSTDTSHALSLSLSLSLRPNKHYEHMPALE